MEFKIPDIEAYSTEYVTHKLFDIALIGLRNILNNINSKKNIIKIKHLDKYDCINYVNHHLKESIEWACTVSFRHSNSDRNIEDIFVDLDLYLSPIKQRPDPDIKVESKLSSEILSKDVRNIVLLGQPGAGKTTTIKKLLLNVINKENEYFQLLNFPLLINLKDFNNNKYTKYVLLETILLKLGVILELQNTNHELIFEFIFKEFIERLNILIILDGFDEIYDLNLRNIIISNLNIIANSISSTRFIMTSRTADYSYHIPRTTEYELKPLTENQIKVFINKWIPKNTQLNNANDFFKKLKNSPYWDTAIRPLTLAHLCAIQERYNEIPDKPKTLYKRIINLLLEEWNNERSVVRVSKYSRFNVESKIDFLARFAYVLTTEYSSLRFDSIMLRKIYNEICFEFDLPINDEKYIIQEIESHNGLIIQTSNDCYEFSHRSLQEYLVADYLVKLPTIIEDKNLIYSIPNEVAIMISISTNPNLAFYKIIVDTIRDGCFEASFFEIFFERLKIEKPDYKNDILYPISIIFLFNEISRTIYYIKTGTIVNKSFKDISKYEIYIEKLLEMIDEDIFRKSTPQIKDHFNISRITINNDAKMGLMNRYGVCLLAKPKVSHYKTQGIRVNLLESIVIPENWLNKNK